MKKGVYLLKNNEPSSRDDILYERETMKTVNDENHDIQSIQSTFTGWCRFWASESTTEQVDREWHEVLSDVAVWVLIRRWRQVKALKNPLKNHCRREAAALMFSIG